MILFGDLNTIFQGVFLVFLLILVLASIVSILVVFQHGMRNLYLFGGVGLFLISFSLFFLVLCDYNSMNELNKSNFCLLIHNTPLLFLWIVLIIVLIAISFLYYKIFRYYKKNITKTSIKESIDHLPMGLCYYSLDGQIILKNKIMNDICTCLFNQALLNGSEFFNEIINLNKKDVDSFDENIVHIATCKDKRVFNIERKLLKVDNTDVYLIVAKEITHEFELNGMLERKKQILSNMNLRLLKYNENVVELTRDKEILLAKIHIHDELGKLLLMAKRTMVQSTIQERLDLISTLNKNNTLLSKDLKPSNSFDDFLENSRKIGLSVDIKGICDTVTITNDIFLTALKECATNAVSHANAYHLFVEFIQIEKKQGIVITNDGEIPTQDIVEKGGLLSLRRLVKNNCGTMIISSQPVFKLSIYLEEQNGQDKNTRC